MQPLIAMQEELREQGRQAEARGRRSREIDPALHKKVEALALPRIREGDGL